MNELVYRSSEINGSVFDYDAHVKTITERTLSPDNITTYAKDSLEELVALVGDITAVYAHQPTIRQPNGIDEERAALRYSGLDVEYIESALDHIADIDQDIVRIGGLVEKMTRDGDVVITPPDRGVAKIKPGEGSVNIGRIVPRLQTTLLILEKHFGVALEDTNQLRVIPGVVDDTMMRQTAYNIVDIPGINRVVSVCDEESNRTFVFDREKLFEHDVTLDTLKDLTKKQIKTLLMTHDGIGSRLTYSTRFVENLTSLLMDIPEKSQEIPLATEAAQLLAVERVPKGHRTISTLATLFKVDRRTILKTLQEHAPDFGEVLELRGKNQHVTKYYSVEQVAVIEALLRDDGYLIEVRPAGYMSVPQLCARLKVNPPRIYEAMTELGDSIGEVHRYRSTRGVASEYFSFEQSCLIKAHLEQKGLIGNAPPEGYKSKKALAIELRVQAGILQKAIDDLGSALGQSESYKPLRGGGGKHTRYFSLQQQATLRDWLAEHGYVADDIPENYLTLNDAAEKLHAHRFTLQKAIEGLGSSLGTVQQYKKLNTVTDCLSSEQVDMVEAWIKSMIPRSKLAKQAIVSTSE